MNTDTSYLGLRLPHPFVAGASPLGYRIDSLKRVEDGGAAAVVLHSLFEEQITQAVEGRIAHATVADRDFIDVVGAFPASDEYPFSPDAYLEHVVRAKAALGIPVIASLNGRTGESWLRFAKGIEQAGADGLELNVYDVATDPSQPGVALEAELVSTVRELKRLLKIPLAVKLTPFFTSFANIARQLDMAGADALVLFNRFYQPDIDITTTTLSPHAELSSNAELRLRLRWLAILHGRVRPALAVTGGVQSGDDGVKAVLAGADVVQVVSALLRHGPAHIGEIRRSLERWMEWNHVERIDQVRGRLSLSRSSDPAAFERAQYIHTLHSWIR
jgi:dihydroorotate dehydrogenase (fumarate)